jgi:hypothetical protein
MYKTDHGDFMGAGSGCGGGGGAGIGWLNFQDGISTSYPDKSMMQCLIDAGITSTTLKDPSGKINCTTNTDCFAYMKYNCSNGSMILLANLEGIAKSTTALDPAVAQCPGLSTTLDDAYGMDYWVLVS